MKKIIFWNIERLSPHLPCIAEKAKHNERRIVDAVRQQALRRAGSKPTQVITRSHVKNRPKLKDIPLSSRDFYREAWNLFAWNSAEKEVEQLRNKYNLSLDLPHSAPYVFYCEVVATHPDARNPLRSGTAHTNSTLCYAYYNSGVSMPFSNCPLTNGWYIGLPLTTLRVPKSVTIVGRSGPVRFCFWHAPSHNSGSIVATMYAGLNASGAPFVLFGDLNAEPHQLMAQGVPMASIINPGTPTRISGRCLDYAITNVPDQFIRCRPLYTGAENQNIKRKTGSDHMVMILELK